MINKAAAKILLQELTPDSNFLNENYSDKDCLYNFALYKLMNDKIEWKWITLVGQRKNLSSTINV